MTLPVKVIDNVSVSFPTNGPNFDAFDRLRVSNPQTLFGSKQCFESPTNFWDDQEVSGSGTSSTYLVNRASTTLNVSVTTSGRRIRQTYMRFNYQPGKSHMVLVTGVLSASGGGAGIVAGMGLYDDQNGLFARYNEGTLQFVKRSYVTGSAVDTAVDQNDWNIDKFDGSGPSGVILDVSKAQILFIDFEWLGVGRVRMGWMIDGIVYYAHQFLHANVINSAYMSTPNLPIRYELENDGSGAVSTLEAICSSVASEGGLDLSGPVFSANLGVDSINANSIGTYYALIGLRPKTTHIGATIKVIVDNILALTNDNFLWEVRLNPTVAGTFTYNAISYTGVEVALGDTSGNPSTNTVTGGQIIRSAYVTGGTAARNEVWTSRHLGAAIDGTRDELVLCVTPLTNNLDITGGITWGELV